MLSSYFMFRVLRLAVGAAARFLLKAIPHNSKYRYGERGAASAGAVLKPQGGNYAVLPYLSLQAVWRRSVILPASFCPIWREYQNLRLT
ncbi:MAG: hypothetical protein WA039_00290, partial [Gemmiger qucibialis]